MADFFGKDHKNVLRDIDHIAHGSNLSGGWFVERREAHPTVSGRMDRTFDMTRDGFSLLVMGYTGPNAMEFKVRYIERFSMMETELRQQQPQVPQSYAEALRAAADAEEQRQIAQQEATAQQEWPQGVGH